WSPARGSYVRAFGVGDIASGRPMSLADHVRVGSVTKPFTATLVLQQVRRGRLRLDERLSRFYPRFPGARTITIRELLNHSSGIYDYAIPRSSGSSSRIRRGAGRLPSSS